MDIRTAFGSYLKAADIEAAGGSVKVKMKLIKLETMKDNKGDEEEKPVLYFSGTEKGLVLNKTNSDRIASVHGWETDTWVGKMIELYVENIEAFGKMQDAIRVRIPKLAAPAQPLKRHVEVMQAPDDEEPPPLDDEVNPFA